MLMTGQLNPGFARRDMFGSVQSIATQATDPGVIASTLVPGLRSTAAGAVSQATAALSSVVSEAASVETSVISQTFAGNYTVGTKYACAASSCAQIFSLEVILCFGALIAGISVITSALAFCLPFMGLSTLGCSMLAMLFSIVFAVCAVTIAEIGLLADRATFIHAQKGEVFAQSLWILGSAVVLAISAVGIFLVPLR